ncbi:MAG: hypothetical protein QF915_01870 [Candidatus Woesearchaeota archaeon]|jgi:Zn-dependent protease|nr:hypothetical protein [Candidatus Woesearchaeota archaeon]MDP7457932.1 hypothetical protein [Candidatus Woesearchaeota archaeon]
MATGLRNYWDKIKRYYPFNKEEKKALIITILALTFMVGFNDGNKQFIFSRWLINFSFLLIGVGISVLFHETGHRLAAFPAGFRVEYQLWWYGLLIGIIFTIFSKGNVWVLVPGGIWAHHMLIHRLGFFRYGPNTLAVGIIGLAGPIASIIFATWIKTIDWLFFASTNLFLQKLFIFNLAFALWSLVPIPPLDGSRVFFHSRLTFSFIFGCILGYTILAALGIYSWILALIIGGVIWLVYYVYFEMGAWVNY